LARRPLHKHEARAPTHPTRGVSAPRSQDRPLAAGRRFDRHAGSNAEGARARKSAVGTAAGIATAIAPGIVLTADNIAETAAIATIVVITSRGICRNKEKLK
jgi:hypothetical protein